jgi:molybdopterin-guanine dinucleotide biosynthesis protein A
MPEPFSVIILAGGRSERMGRDKAWLIFDNQPLVLHVAQRMLPLAGQLIISSNDPTRYATVAASLAGRVPVRIVSDSHPGAGPLAGLEAGLAAAGQDLALMIAVDMPFLNLSLVSYMAELAADYDVVVPVIENAATGQTGREPLHAFYRRACLPAISAHLAEGHRRVISFFPDVRVRDVFAEEIRRFDPEYMSFFNVNTPEDWERAQSALRAGHGPGDAGRSDH